MIATTPSNKSEQQTVTLNGRLTERVRSVKERERSLLIAAPATTRRPVRRFLYRHHTAGKALGVAIAVWVLPLLVSCIAACGHATPSDDAALRQIDGSLSSVLTIAQVMGGVYAILLAVVVFSVQLHAQRDDESAIMVRYLVRMHSVYWVSALAVGLTLANASVPLLYACGLPLNLRVFMYVDLPAIGLTLIWSLWLLTLTIRHATASTYDTTIGEVREDMMRVIAADQYHADIFDAFEKALANTRVHYSSFAFATSRQSTRWKAQFPLLPLSYVRDINLDALRELNDLLSPLPREIDVELTAGPGEAIDQTAALVISCQRPRVQQPSPSGGDEDEIESAHQSARPAAVVAEEFLTENRRREIQRLLTAMFVPGSPPVAATAELNEFLERLRDRLLSLAKEGSFVRFEATLGRLHGLVKYWAGIATDMDPGAAPRWFRDSRQQFAGPLAVELREVVIKAVESEDKDLTEAILRFLMDVAYAGLISKHLRLLDEGCRFLSLAYFVGIRSEKTKSLVARQLDSDLHSLLMSFAARRASSHDDETNDLRATYAEEQPRLDRVLALGLGLLRSALDEGRQEDVEHFFERLFQHREFRHRSSHAAPRQPTEETPESVHDFVLLVVVGWAANVLTSGAPESRGAAEAVLAEAKKLLPPRHELIGLWELYHRDGASHRVIGQRLGVSEWDIRDKSQGSVT